MGPSRKHRHAERSFQIPDSRFQIPDSKRMMHRESENLESGARGSPPCDSCDPWWNLVWNLESFLGCDDAAGGLFGPGMGQDGQSVGIGLDPVGTDDDLGAIGQPVSGDLGDDA